MDESDKQEILHAIDMIASLVQTESARTNERLDRLEAGQARIEADVADVKAGQARASADIRQSQQAIAENYFRTGGRVDQVANMLVEHMATGHKPAAE